VTYKNFLNEHDMKGVQFTTEKIEGTSIFFVGESDALIPSIYFENLRNSVSTLILVYPLTA